MPVAIIPQSQCEVKWRWIIKSSSNLRYNLRYIISQKPTWIIIRFVLKVPCRIPCPILRQMTISRSGRGINRKQFYLKITFPITILGLIHPHPHRKKLILWFIQGLIHQFPWVIIIQFPTGYFLIFPKDMSNILEYSYGSTSYKYTPTNSKVYLVDSDYPTYEPSTNPTKPTKISRSNILQHIWSGIFNDKQEPKDRTIYNGNDNHWRKAKEKWDAAISAAKFNYILKSDYIPPGKSKKYEWNTYDLTDSYIFKILDLNLPTSDSHKCRNALERFSKRDPNVEELITNGNGA